MIFTWLENLTDLQLVAMPVLGLCVLYAVVMIVSSFGRKL